MDVLEKLPQRPLGRLEIKSFEKSDSVEICSPLAAFDSPTLGRIIVGFYLSTGANGHYIVYDPDEQSWFKFANRDISDISKADYISKQIYEWLGYTYGARSDGELMMYTGGDIGFLMEHLDGESITTVEIDYHNSSPGCTALPIHVIEPENNNEPQKILTFFAYFTESGNNSRLYLLGYDGNTWQILGEAVSDVNTENISKFLSEFDISPNETLEWVKDHHNNETIKQIAFERND